MASGRTDDGRFGELRRRRRGIDENPIRFRPRRQRRLRPHPGPSSEGVTSSNVRPCKTSMSTSPKIPLPSSEDWFGVDFDRWMVQLLFFVWFCFFVCLFCFFLVFWVAIPLNWTQMRGGAPWLDFVPTLAQAPDDLDIDAGPPQRDPLSLGGLMMKTKPALAQRDGPSPSAMPGPASPAATAAAAAAAVAAAASARVLVVRRRGPAPSGAAPSAAAVRFVLLHDDHLFQWCHRSVTVDGALVDNWKCSSARCRVRLWTCDRVFKVRLGVFLKGRGRIRGWIRGQNVFVCVCVCVCVCVQPRAVLHHLTATLEEFRRFWLVARLIRCVPTNQDRRDFFRVPNNRWFAFWFAHLMDWYSGRRFPFGIPDWLPTKQRPIRGSIGQEQEGKQVARPRVKSDA